MSWQLTSFLILGGALALGFAWYERSRPPARVLALVAALAALAVVGRLAFAPFPNVKPTTDIVLFAGYALGGAPGFAVGAVTALVSNIFLSHGPWTPWQMAAWGGVGIGGGALGAMVRRVRHRRPKADTTEPTEPRELGRWSLALACGVAGLGFGVVMDVYLWTSVADQTAASYLAIAARSLPFNLAHIAGNVGFCLLVGPPLVRALRRYRRRFEVRWAARGSAEAGAAISALVLALMGAASFGVSTAEAASPAERAARYLEGSQNRDGGFGASRGSPSSGTVTGEVGLGLAAAGRNPQDVTNNGNSIIDWAKRHTGSDVGAVERTILVVRAAGLDPRHFGGRDLHRELLQHRGDDGSFGGSPNHTAYGVLALRALGEDAGSELVQESTEWLASRRNDDGGYGLDSRSAVDITGAALSAFGAAGEGNGSAARDAVEFVSGEQEPGSGGFGYYGRGSSANAGSTAWAIQGLVATDRGNGATVRRGLSYLKSIQARDGSVPHNSRGDRVWGSGQAIPAMLKKAFPIDDPPRRPPASTPTPREDDEEKAGAVKDKGGGDKGANEDKQRTQRPRKRSGRSGVGSGGGRAVGPSPGGASGRAPGPPASAPSDSTLALPSGAPPAPGLPPSLTLPNAAAGALTTPPVPLPGAPSNPLGSPGRLFSDASGVPLNPLASMAPPSRRHGDPGPRIGAGLLLILLIAGAIALATGGGARARRLWAAARRRT